MPNRLEWERDEKGNLYNPVIISDIIEPQACPKCGCGCLFRQRLVEANWVEDAYLVDGFAEKTTTSAYREHSTGTIYRCAYDGCNHRFTRKWKDRA